MALVNVNFGTSTIANAGGITSGASSVDVQSGHGALIDPDGLITSGSGRFCYIVMIDTSGNREIAKCSDVTGDTLSITRAQQGTTARAFAQNDVIEARVTAGFMNAATGNFVDASNGSPRISDTAFSVAATLADDTWESIGPTGSGADNIWTALDDIPTDVDYIELDISIQAIRTSGVDALCTNILYARANGTTPGNPAIADARAFGGTTVQGQAINHTARKVQVAPGNLFDLKFTNTDCTSYAISIYLIGYGYNSKLA